MQTQITVRHTDASEFHRRYAQEELDRLSKVHSRIENARIVLTEDGMDKKAEVTLGVPGQDFHIEETAPSIEAAIDRCMDRVRRALLKHKDHVRSKDPSRDTWH